MSIHVKKISKTYGDHVVLNKVSFKIKKGEIIGLLGPNGAGKSTLMKILTGYIWPSHGKVCINEINIDPNNIKYKSKIGYLPEHNPLYLDMYVNEYIEFIAKIYNTNYNAVKEIISKTGLTKEKHKIIGSLSKGYKQRVGLAQALIHNPEVLILDEPTTGLDPNQLVEIRSLIKEIGKDKTVVISTHIMQEVEAICDKLIILNNGEIVANDFVKEIIKEDSLENIFRRLTS